MTVEEIKSQKTMFDILPQYNIRPNRSMMVSCPFHKDRHPSMKIYKDGFKCFTCGKYGDIFVFVQEMENVLSRMHICCLVESTRKRKNRVKL